MQVNTEELGGLFAAKHEILRLPEYVLFDLESLPALLNLQWIIADQALMIACVNVFWQLTWMSLMPLPLLALISTSQRVSNR